jgi:hypothetical protein
MTVTGIPAAGPGGALRLTWVRDRLASVLEHCGTDEPSAPGPAWPAPIMAWRPWSPTPTSRPCGSCLPAARPPT